MTEIRLENIYKIYDKKHEAVKDFSLKIEDNEFVVFVGPSGCGKSTTLRMIAGLESISKGELYIDDQLMNDVEPKNRDIAMVFQSYALYPHMTVFENMAFGLKIAKFSKKEIERRVNEAAEILGLKEYLNRKPKALSGGQRQRVALGRAIVRESKVFLMDEPLSNLDAKLRVQMRAEIQKLHKKINTTTIYVTHDQTEAMTMATRIVVMKDGVIQQIGTPENVYKNPKNLFIASFIGSPAMNFFDVTMNEHQFVLNGQQFDIPANYRQELAGYQEVILGIRPEHISVGTQGDYILNARVDVEELLGSESYIHGAIGEQNFIVKVTGDTDFEIGQPYNFALDPSQFIFFNKETEDVIRPAVTVEI